jgi:predicted nucleic acid-binding protein
VALIIDASAMLAQADRDDPAHEPVREVLEAEREALVTSQLAVAEADYLILDRLGVEAWLAFLADLEAGTFVAECLTSVELHTARELAIRYRDLELGLAAISLVLLARRHRTRRLLTFDERGFRNVAPLQGGAFTLLPADR